MSGKRRDHKGRILRTGESQRKDLIYQYRYTDAHGKRQSVYASDLNDLREKEQEIQKAQVRGADYSAGKMTVMELVERYTSLRQGVKYNTKVGYQFVRNILKDEAFGRMMIRDVHVSDAKKWVLKLHEDGRGYSSITSIRGVVKPAFQMAYQDEIITRNPFDFRLDIIPNTSKHRQALTPEQQEAFMTFVREDKHLRIYYDEFNVLLGTGVRVSELVGLTKKDVDFTLHRICVDHQLARTREGSYYVDTTKTKSGVRYIPMSDTVYESLQRIVRSRRNVKVERIIDGYSEFLFIDKNGNPEVAMYVAHHMQWARNKYARTHEEPLPLIMPHVFRHTFCTNMANAGMDIKSLQYLMGHSEVDITLNVYTHSSYEKAEEAMRKILPFPQKEPGGILTGTG